MSGRALSGEGLPSLAPNFPATAARPVVYGLLSLAAAVFTLVAGKDLNWDALNYHLYAGFAALNDRFAQDFLPAGAASYFNPYSYVPFYLLVAAGASGILIGVTLAVAHSINLWLTYEIALALQPGNAERRVPTALLAAVLAGLNPVFLQELGSSFNDISTSIFVLGGWLTLLHARVSPGVSMVAVSGLLLGAGAALKLSNAIFAVAALPLVAVLPGDLRGRFSWAVLWAVCGAAGFLVATGPWSLRLWEVFGNPFFPLFNAWFQSPDFIVEPLKHERFVPLSWSEALLRPFRMMLPERMIHTEPRAADLRYAALIVIAIAWASITVWRRRNKDFSRTSNDPVPAALVAFGLAWMLWLPVSGNSRYFLSMGCVAAALIAVLLQRMGSDRWFYYGGMVVAGLQLGQIAMGTQLRWTEQPWAGPWFDVTVPARFAREPALYLTPNAQSSSFFAPFLARESGLINVSGSYVLGDGRPGTERALRMIDANANRLRLLLPVQSVTSRGEPLPPSVERLNERMKRFGLTVDSSDCDYFKLEGGLDLLVFGDTPSTYADWPRATYFLTCRLIVDRHVDPAYEVESARANRIFDHVEDACPNLFHPRRTVAEKSGYWTRQYVLGSDLQLYLYGDVVKYVNPVVGGEAITIGRAADWEKSPQPMDCSRRRGAGFEGVLE